MAKEIERKFLVDTSLLPVDRRGAYLSQGYLFSQNGRTVRVRIVNNKGYLTIKSKVDSIVRDEYEYEIPLKDAEEMLDLCQGSIVQKTRFLFEVEGKTWEVDEFHGDNEGLWLAEIELTTVSEDFISPKWVVKEVSEDHRYFNSYLSKNPFKFW